MSKQTLIVNIILALILFFGNGWLGKLKANTTGLFGYDSFGFNKINDANFADHFFQKIVHPAILIAIAAAILQHYSHDNLAKDLWLVVPFYWVLRFIHIFIWNIATFTNWKYEITSMIISILLGEGTLFFILRPLIDSEEHIFIDATAFRDAFWFAALSYIAKLIWDISKASLSGASVFPTAKRNRTIVKRYYDFNWEYGAEIDVLLRNNCDFESCHIKNEFRCLLFAIMIYEDHCRPKAVRLMEYAVKVFRWKSVMSLGIMQVQTKKIISDRTSIKLAIDKLYSAFCDADKKECDSFDDAISDYNADTNYYVEVTIIREILRNELGLVENSDEE